MKVQKQIDELLTLRASEWLETMKQPSDADRASFIAWLGESRRHVQEFLEVAAVEAAVGAMRPEAREDLMDLVRRVTGTERMPISLQARPRPAAPAPRVQPRWLWAALASAASIVAIALFLWPTSPHPAGLFATGIGEQRTLRLSDQSIVTLNTASKVELHLDATHRDVELREGEAFFKVVPDHKRPFRVRTRAGVVQVLGTQFNVYARANGETRVAVLEGRVQVSPLEANRSGVAAEFLTAGEEATIQPDGSIYRAAAGAAANSVAWRERRLVFTDAPLEQMIAEFNRYNRAQLQLQNIPVGAYRFAGIFDVDDPESLVALLRRETGLEVVESERGTVIRTRN